MNTQIPNNPGITLFFRTLAPNAAENAGAVPLHPIFIARKIAIRNGIRRWLKSGETISQPHLVNQSSKVVKIII